MNSIGDVVNGFNTLLQVVQEATIEIGGKVDPRYFYEARKLEDLVNEKLREINQSLSLKLGVGLKLGVEDGLAYVSLQPNPSYLIESRSSRNPSSKRIRFSSGSKESFGNNLALAYRDRVFDIKTLEFENGNPRGIVPHPPTHNRESPFYIPPDEIIEAIHVGIRSDGKRPFFYICFAPKYLFTGLSMLPIDGNHPALTAVSVAATTLYGLNR